MTGQWTKAREAAIESCDGLPYSATYGDILDRALSALRESGYICISLDELRTIAPRHPAIAYYTAAEKERE